MSDQTSVGQAPWWARVETDGDILLRALDPADAPGVLRVHGDPRVYEYDPHETHPDLDHTRRFIEPMLGHWREHGFGYWTVLVPHDECPDGVVGDVPGDDGRVIAGLGGIHLHTVENRPVLNVYFRLAPEVHGRGIAGTVVANVIRIAPHVAPGRDIVVRTRPANAAARRVAIRAGFVDEGPEPGSTDMQLLRYPAPEPDRACRGGR